MNLTGTNYNLFGSPKFLKLLSNLDWTSKLLPSKNEIHSQRGFERVRIIEWE